MQNVSNVCCYSMYDSENNFYLKVPKSLHGFTLKDCTASYTQFAE